VVSTRLHFQPCKIMIQDRHEVCQFDQNSMIVSTMITDFVKKDGVSNCLRETSLSLNFLEYFFFNDTALQNIFTAALVKS